MFGTNESRTTGILYHHAAIGDVTLGLDHAPIADVATQRVSRSSSAAIVDNEVAYRTFGHPQHADLGANL